MAKVLFTGRYESDYNRTVIIREGLRELGISVEEMPYASKRQLNKPLLKAVAQQCDWVFLPSFTHADVRYIKRLLPHLPLVFDPLVSRYLTKVFDYKSIGRFSPRALKNFWKDQRAMRAADIVLADTAAHKQYYAETFGIAPGKIHVLYIGVHDAHFRPQPPVGEPADVLRVGFYGSYVPLQGAEQIVRAADLLRDLPHLRFELLGDGIEHVRQQVLALAKHLGLDNIHFSGRVDYADLNAHINRFDICLGIFGDSLKADLVIPNKLYHYAACGKAIITKDTPAVRELFSPGQDIHLCKATPQHLAAAIRHLAADPDERAALGQRAAALVREHYHQRKVAQRLLGIVQGA